MVSRSLLCLAAIAENDIMIVSAFPRTIRLCRYFHVRYGCVDILMHDTFVSVFARTIRLCQYSHVRYECVSIRTHDTFMSICTCTMRMCPYSHVRLVYVKCSHARHVYYECASAASEAKSFQYLLAKNLSMSGPACSTVERLLSQQLLDRLACGLFCWVAPFLLPSIELLSIMWVTPNARTTCKTQGYQFDNNYDNSVITGPITLKFRMHA